MVGGRPFEYLAYNCQNRYWSVKFRVVHVSLVFINSSYDGMLELVRKNEQLIAEIDELRDVGASFRF